jgi:starvation-inducible DNA-binding protein
MAAKTAATPTANGTAAKTFPTRHDLSADARRELVALLNQQLADTTDLRTQTKHAHWNVKGPNFIALHKLFDELAALLAGFGDEIAERATALGGVAAGTARTVAANSRIKEFPADAFDGTAVLTALADRYARLAKSTRAAIARCEELDDQGTMDLFTEVVRGLDKSLYFLEAHLQG